MMELSYNKKDLNPGFIPQESKTKKNQRITKQLSLKNQTSNKLILIKYYLTITLQLTTCQGFLIKKRITLKINHMEEEKEKEGVEEIIEQTRITVFNQHLSLLSKAEMTIYLIYMILTKTLSGEMWSKSFSTSSMQKMSNVQFVWRVLTI